jgi:hypothetical protein
MKILLLFILSIMIVSCEFSKNDESKRPTSSAEESDGSNEDSERTTDNIPTPTDPNLPPIQVPHCESICNKTKSIIKSNNEGFSYLSFANFGYRGIGRCRGHALLTQQMSILAKFNPNISCDTNSSECLNKLILGVQKIIENKTHVFNGYESLYDLSQVPEVKQYIYDHIKLVNHQYSANPVYIENDLYNTRALKVFYELEKRATEGQVPYVGVIGKQTGSHALLIYKTDYVGNRDVLCARDSNIVTGQAEDCSSYIFVENNRVFYKRYDRSADFLSKFELTSDEDKRVRTYANSLYKNCLVIKKLNGLCK